MSIIVDECGLLSNGMMRPGPMQPMLFLPPPPEHPPPSDIGTPPDSPTPSRRSDHYGRGPIRPVQMGKGSHSSLKTPEGLQRSMNMSDYDNNRTYSPQMMGTGGKPSMGNNNQYRPDSANRAKSPPSSNKHWTMSPRSQYQDTRAYSPRAMSEPERGPTPPIRGYKLVPIRDGEPHRHYSDTEGVPVPPLRSLVQTPPSPRPASPHEEYEDPMMDRAIQSSLPSLASECLTTPMAR
jgi:hypothetical protein